MKINKNGFQIDTDDWVFIAIIVFIIAMACGCNKETSATQNAWVSVKAQNVEVVTLNAKYREIIFDFTTTSDSQGQNLLTLPLSTQVVVEYKNNNYVFDLPPNEATIRLGKNLIVTDTIQPINYRIIAASYPNQSIKINF